MNNTIRMLTAGAAMLIASAAGVLGADFTFTGNLSNPDDVRLFGFTVTSPSTVTLQTRSYSTGGFDPALSLFGTNGTFRFNDDINGNLDARIIEDLAVGTYTLALTQIFNFPVGTSLEQGFTGGGVPNFGNRTSAFTVDILNVATASAFQPPTAGVPDTGSTFALFIFGLGGLVSFRRFFRRG